MYSNFSLYYDSLMGQSYVNDYIKIILDNIAGNKISDFKILDLGCGTGTFLSKISSDNITYGIDISKNNINIAKKKDSKSNFILGNITDFNLDIRFDIITCCFDTINHLNSKILWKKLFKNVSKHLNLGGVFIFDINTINKFNKINGKSIIKQIGEDYIIIETSTISNSCNFKISIFSHLDGNYKLDVENINEITFREDEVISMLSEFFSSIKLINDNDERVFFICKK